VLKLIRDRSASRAPVVLEVFGQSAITVRPLPVPRPDGTGGHDRRAVSPPGRDIRP